MELATRYLKFFLTLFKILFKYISHDTIQRKSVVRSWLIMSRCGWHICIPICTICLAYKLLVQFINSVGVDESVPGWVLLAKGVIELPYGIGEFYKRIETSQCLNYELLSHFRHLTSEFCFLKICVPPLKRTLFSKWDAYGCLLIAPPSPRALSLSKVR